MVPNIYHTLVVSSDVPDGALLKFRQKEYQSSVYYCVDLSERLMSNDKLSFVGAVSNDSNMPLAVYSISDKTFIVKIGAGTANTISICTFNVTTVLNENIYIEVLIKNAAPEICTGTAKPSVIVNGLSAYQVAVANGFEGTESEWLASLSGQASDVTYKSVTAGTVKGLLLDSTVLINNEPVSLDRVLGNVLSMALFNADPTGNTDSTAAFNAANNSNAAIIIIEKGTYAISQSPPDLGKSRIWIFMDGASISDSSIILPGNVISLKNNSFSFKGKFCLPDIKDYKGANPSDLVAGSKTLYAQNGVVMVS